MWAGSTLHALTGGNPFYVTETLAAPRSSDVPETVAQSVVARVRRLSPRCRRALEQLSIVPRLVEFDIAEHLLGDELGALDEAEERGVIEVRADGIAFRHELARRAVQGSVPRLRRRQLHGAVARALMARPETGPGRDRASRGPGRRCRGRVPLCAGRPAGRPLRRARIGRHWPISSPRCASPVICRRSTRRSVLDRLLVGVVQRAPLRRGHHGVRAGRRALRGRAGPSRDG